MNTPGFMMGPIQAILDIIFNIHIFAYAVLLLMYSADLSDGPGLGQRQGGSINVCYDSQLKVECYGIVLLSPIIVI